MNKNDKENINKLLGIDNTPIMLQNPAVVEQTLQQQTPIGREPAQVPVDQGVNPITATQLISSVSQPREANYVAPKIVAPQNVDNKVADDEYKNSLSALQTEYKKALQDAEDRKFKASIFASIGNHLPGAIAGATAMNTHAAVKPLNTPELKVDDIVAPVHNKYKTDAERLLDRYKAAKSGTLTAKDLYYGQIVDAQNQISAAKINANTENTDRNGVRRDAKLILQDQEKNELSDKQAGELSDIDNTLAEISRIHGQAEKFKDKLGPTKSRIEQEKEGIAGPLVKKLAGPIDEQYVKFRSDAKALQGAYQKIISGLTVSEPERKELRSYIPNPDMPYEAFKANAEAFERRAKQLREKKMTTLGKYQGKNIQGYKTEAPKTNSETVMIQGPSGGAPVAVRKDQAQKYLSKPGYKLSE